MLALPLTLVLLAAAPAPPPVLASPDFQTVNVPADVARFANEHLAQELAARGLRVATARDIDALLGLERQRQLAGCAEGQSACLTELANALGADGLLLGDLARLGGRWQLNLKVLRSTDGTRVASHSATLTRESELVPELTRAAAALAPAVLRGFGRAPAVPAPDAVARTDAGRKRWPLWPTVAAGALAVGGGVSLAVSSAANAKLRDASVPLTEEEGRATADRGRRFQTLGWVGVGGAAVGLATAGLWYALSGDAAAVPTVTAVPGGGAAVGLSGRLP